jgi:hypothetical protein
VKERKGAIGRATGIAETVVAGIRRRQQARAPRVLLYDDDGRPRTLDAAGDATLEILVTAQEMVALAGPGDPDAESGDPLDAPESAAPLGEDA